MPTLGNLTHPTQGARGGGGETHTIGQFYIGIGGGKSATSQNAIFPT